MPSPRNTRRVGKLTPIQVGLKHGFRSGLEERVADQLTAAGIVYEYEAFKLPFVQPAKKRNYCPDYWLPNGIIIETKGQFITEDRQKHLWVREAHPHLDIRFVFSNSQSKINKRSPTTYAIWCRDNGFKYADKLIPQAWLNEPKKDMV